MRVISVNLMKKFLLTLTLLLPFSLFGQELYTASNQPTALYHQINDALTANKPRLAERLFQGVVEFYEQNADESVLPESYFGMALAFALNGHYRESIRYHKKALKIHRKYRNDEATEITINLGLTYQLAGKERKAKKILGQNLMPS